MQPALLPSVFGDRHLLGIEGLSAGAITYLLDLSESYVALNREVQKRRSLLGGRTVLLLFFETSTRTRTSFELAGKRLGADVINIAVASSAIKKGETLIDTAMTLNAMHPDMLIMRHPDAGAALLLAGHVECGVINAGDGSHEHPTQALLDALTIRRRFGRIQGLQGRHLRRCAAQPGRALQHPAAQRDGGERPRHRAADAAAGGGRAPRRRGLPRHAQEDSPAATSS